MFEVRANWLVIIFALTKEISIVDKVGAFCTLSKASVHYAGVAQLVERQPSKLQVAGSNLVSRSIVV